MNSIPKKYFIIYFEVSSSASKTVQMSLGADADWKEKKKVSMTSTFLWKYFDPYTFHIEILNPKL